MSENVIPISKAGVVTAVSADLLGKVLLRMIDTGQFTDRDAEQIGVAIRALEALAAEEGVTPEMLTGKEA